MPIESANRNRVVLSPLVLPLALALGCATPDPSTEIAALVEGTGMYSRPVSTESAWAQRFFDQGLRLTYGYYFPEAAASFQQALLYDAHPMIYWGLAMAVSPNPNSRYMGFADDPKGEGEKAIEQARQLSSRASASERAFIDALFVRYDSDATPDRDERDRAYLQQARALTERYPDDPDAATFYADAIMTLSPWVYWDSEGEARPGTLDAAGALERAVERHPAHPGANHLYIHLLEASAHPERAVAQADRLEALMPGAGHIVHMPSHIYVRVGRYDDAIAANERSIEADRLFLDAWGDRPFPDITSHKLSAVLHSWHANDFIRYAAAVQGNYERAIETARSAAAVAVETQTMANGRAQRAVATIWIVHKIFGKWNALLDEEPPTEGSRYLDGMLHYARGSAFVGIGQLERARRELDRLGEAALNAIVRLPGLANSPPALLEIAVLGLRGEIAQATGDLDAAIEAFEQAVALEARLSYIEPPDWSQPMRHYLGAALLAAKRPAEAERVYREDLRWNQGNGWGLFGLWQSLRDQGREDAAEQLHRHFVEAWRGADVTLRASRF